MKRLLIVIMILAASGSLFGAILETWDFTKTGTDPVNNYVSQAPSVPGGVELNESGVIQLANDTASITYAGKANSFGDVNVPSMGSGLNSGVYQLQWTVLDSDFSNTYAAGKNAQFGFGFSDTGGSTPQCLAMFRFNGTAFEISSIGIPDISATTIAPSGQTQISMVAIRIVLDLDNRGSAGSAKIYYTVDGTEFMLSGTLPATFSIDAIYQKIDITIDGASWQSGDVTFIDDMHLSTGDSLIFEPELSFIAEGISFIEDNGVIPSAYEPGDILQIITTNQNNSIYAATGVTTTLWADPNVFTITPLSSNAYPSIAPAETYTGVFQVTILDGATNGPNTFTVTNRINSASPDSIAFPQEFNP